LSDDCWGDLFKAIERSSHDVNSICGFIWSS